MVAVDGGMPSEFRLLTPMLTGDTGSSRECFTSLFRRLCEHNQLSVIDVVVSMAIPISGPSHDRTYKLCNPIHLLNSGGTLSSRAISRVGQVTALEDLANTTLHNFQSICGMQPLRSSRYRRWCSLCFEEDRCSKHGPFERLLWSIECVEVCPLHHCRLEQTCHKCGATNFSVLLGADISGFCPKCLTWLGGYRDSLDLNSDEHVRYLQWIAAAFMELLDDSFDHESLNGRNISIALEVVRKVHFSNKASSMAKAIGRNKSTLSTWVNHHSAYSWLAACQISYAFGISLKSLLLNDEDALYFTHVRPLPLMVRASVTSIRKRAGTVSESSLRLLIEKLRNGEHSQLCTLKASASMLGVDQKTLRNNFPDLYADLALLLRSKVTLNRDLRKRARRLSLSIATQQVASDLAADFGKVTRRELSRRFGLVGVRPSWTEMAQICRTVRETVFQIRQGLNSGG
jgi:TniQ